MRIRKVSDKGIQLIKSFEGYRAEAYQDSVGVWTIGYGETGHIQNRHIHEGLVINEWIATQLLKLRLQEFEAEINKILPENTSQGCFDAFVSLAYNVGVTAVANSTALKNLKEQKWSDMYVNFLRFNRAGNKMEPGLIRRRKAEVHLWITGELKLQGYDLTNPLKVE